MTTPSKPKDKPSSPHSGRAGTLGPKGLAPGDEAAPGTPGTGEDLCPDCGGSGRREGRACPTCAGTGRVTEGIGGG